MLCEANQVTLETTRTEAADNAHVVLWDCTKTECDGMDTADIDNSKIIDRMFRVRTVLAEMAEMDFKS